MHRVVLMRLLSPVELLITLVGSEMCWIKWLLDRSPVQVVLILVGGKVGQH